MQNLFTVITVINLVIAEIITIKINYDTMNDSCIMKQICWIYTNKKKTPISSETLKPY